MTKFKITTHIFCASLLQATASLHSAPQISPHADVEHLEPLVVSSRLDERTLFDLAQGASIVSGGELQRRREDTLGETLAALPGLASTYYGPGSSRPLIRGMGGERVRMLQGGLGTQDVSSISPDHAVSVEPGLVERIEVLRGPATLLYGNSAIGGVVNVIDGRIPLDPGPNRFRAEGRYSSANEGATGLFSARVGSPEVAVVAQGLRTQTDDLRVGGGATLSGSSVRTTYGAAGAAWRGSKGAFGAAASSYESQYDIPGGAEAIAIDLLQRRLELEGNLQIAEGPVRAVEAKMAINDYRHHERDRETGEIHTTYTQKGSEARIEARQARRGDWGGVFGINIVDTKLDSLGEETIIPPVDQESAALFVLEEWKPGAWAFQAGARVERQRIRLGMVSEALPEVPGYQARSGDRREDYSTSLAFGAVWKRTSHDSFALSLTSSQRLPTAQELYSNGPHGGTSSYEVGTSSLDRENAYGVDLTYRRRHKMVTGSVGLFAHAFKGYIYERRLPDDAVEEALEEGLPIYQFSATDAVFTGAEAEVDVHLIDREGESLHLLTVADFVRAEDTGSNVALPRIPPWRVRSELRYTRGVWHFGTAVQYVGRQTRLAPEETPTPGHALWSAEIARHWQLKSFDIDLFVRGQNLLDRLARVHTSFLKDAAPLAGRNFVIGARVEF